MPGRRCRNCAQRRAGMFRYPSLIVFAASCLAVSSAAIAQAPGMPDKQQQFLSIVDAFATKYKAAPNDMAKGALRPQRAKALCDLLKSVKVTDWAGTVRKLSSNNEGKGVLVVTLNRASNVATWNNALSDMSDRTLIQPGTPLHEAAIQLSRNQTIIFSGSFIRGDTDCIRESSLSQSGSMTDPDWIFQFLSVKPAS